MGNETKPNGPKIGYGVLEKGNEYSRSRYAKPDSSNAASIILDTGKDLIKGRCYDHHQLSQEDKARFPSATSMVYEYAQDIYDVNKAAIDNGQRIDLVCHDFPDTDAILSVVLAKQILENGGELPVGAEQLVRYANESDTFTFKPGFGFGAMLTTIINEEYPKARSFMQKKDAIDTCVCFTETILEEYQKLVAKEQDPEKRAEIDFDSTLASMMDQRSDYRRRQQANWRYFNKCKDQIDKKTLTSIKAMRNLINDLSSKGSEYNNGEITARDKNSKNAFASQDHIGYEIFDVRLCKKQLTKEEQAHDLEKDNMDAQVFVYTGATTPYVRNKDTNRDEKLDLSLMELEAKKNFDVTIFPKYDLEKGTVTIKISSQVEGYDLGHFGRYIESLIYQEALDKTKSPLKGDAFKKRKEEFVSRLKPYKKGMEDKHFTTYEPTCGNDPTFFGYKVPLDSNLASLSFLRDTMQDYFNEPQKIHEEEFEEIVGKENLDGLNAKKRPEIDESKAVNKPKKIIMVNNQGMTKQINKPHHDNHHDKHLDEIASVLADSNLDEKDVDNVLKETIAGYIEEQDNINNIEINENDEGLE